MRVVFLQDVPGIADAGEVKEVKNGFARNHLIPRQLAAPATVDHLQRTKTIQRAAEERRARESNEMQVVADRINGATILIETRVGPTGRLYGSITSRQIAEEASKVTGQPIDHRMVLLPRSIHEPGDYPMTLRLYREVTADVTISVVPEGYQQQQAARQAAGEGAVPPAEAPAEAEEEALEPPPEEESGVDPEEPQRPEASLEEEGSPELVEHGEESVESIEDVGEPRSEETGSGVETTEDEDKRE